MRKPDFCHGKNKGADQLCSDCTTDQRLCFCYMDSTIPLLPKLEISNFCSCPGGFVPDLVGNPDERFSHIAAHLMNLLFYIPMVLPGFLGQML